MDSPSAPALAGRGPPPPLPLLAAAASGWASACVRATLGTIVLAGAPAPAECTESLRGSPAGGLRGRACPLGMLRQLSMGPRLGGPATGTGTDDGAGTSVIAIVLRSRGGEHGTGCNRMGKVGYFRDRGTF